MNKKANLKQLLKLFYPAQIIFISSKELAVLESQCYV